jgi:peroxiredoxin
VALQPRQIVLAALAGVTVAAISLFGGVWLAGALDGDAAVDGEFVLDQPGIFQQPADDVNADVTGDRVPDAALTDSDGREVRLTDYAGQPMVVNFWFSRCAPCRRELSDFATVHADIGGDVQFVGVDPFDTVAAMEEFAAERGVTYDLLRDDGSLSNELGIVGYPVTLFVDANGRILRQTGEIDAETLRTTIETLF